MADDANCGGSSCGCESSPISADGAPAATKARMTWFNVPALDCASEEAEIRRILDGHASIAGLRFDLSGRRLGIASTEPGLALAQAALNEAGFPAQRIGEGQSAVDAVLSSEPPKLGWTRGAGMERLVAALLLAIVAESISFFAPSGMLWQLTGGVIAATAIGLAGLQTYQKGLVALRHRKLNINALMTVAVTGAFLIGQWPEAAMVMALYAIAELIEARSVDRARNAIKGLLEMAPTDALVRNDAQEWVRQPVAEIEVGRFVRIRPGERVPLDGTVFEGRSAVNQAPITGESLPVDKEQGAPVFAGSINETGELTVRVTALAKDTTLARIIHAVEEAQGSRAPTQRFVDRFATFYTPAVFVLALAVALLAPWLAGWSWMESIYKALVLLVIACPCALVISTPVTVVSALAAAARRGILIKGGVYLEQARQLRVVALDKTGTITEGKPKLVSWEVIQGDRIAIANMAASLAGRSDHPVSQAILKGLETVATEAVELNAFEALAGRGVRARRNSTTYVLGNHRLIEERAQCNADIEARLAVHERAGRSVTLLASEQGVLALFAVADTIKASSRKAIEDLKSLGVHAVMLSGDNQATAQTIADQAGIRQAIGNLLPQDKLQSIAELQQQHGMVAMTGDGINDAPALSKADVGVAMGGAGTDTAMEAADVVIMNDDLRRIPELIRLSRRTHVVLWQNISLALGIKLVFLILAVVADASMWMAVFADMGASLLVVFNGLRLLRQQPAA